MSRAHSPDPVVLEEEAAEEKEGGGMVVAAVEEKVGGGMVVEVEVEVVAVAAAWACHRVSEISLHRRERNPPMAAAAEVAFAGRVRFPQER